MPTEPRVNYDDEVEYKSLAGMSCLFPIRLNWMPIIRITNLSDFLEVAHRNDTRRINGGFVRFGRFKFGFRIYDIWDLDK
jgi:hypothetical protein